MKAQLGYLLEFGHQMQTITVAHDGRHDHQVIWTRNAHQLVAQCIPRRFLAQQTRNINRAQLVRITSEPFKAGDRNIHREHRRVSKLRALSEVITQHRRLKIAIAVNRNNHDA
ncbi:Uncharacterised protein [Vibrio cholerae]|uniref:Uncharacterized protein n=1 Tax=Vibrio cholerae TaxID=666 RepID=A0A655QK61_VIBCL|nr:Uncharacterised protein [Vibrio cholerae]CSA63570.1 Uncharacterised protein [Vibrio cholerae]CSB13060.1 Uncharacterised protein [Vibrio cholerae]